MEAASRIALCRVTERQKDENYVKNQSSTGKFLKQIAYPCFISKTFDVMTG